MHGYDIHGDLAQHYHGSDIFLTGLRGRPPSPSESELFDAILAFLSPVSVGEAACHGAVLTRACGGTAASVVAVGATLLAEHSEALLAAHAKLFPWLDSTNGTLPEEFRCRSGEEREVVQLLAQRLARSTIRLPILALDPTLFSALFAACHQCGLIDHGQILAVIVFARLPGLLAEALSSPLGDRMSYPMDLPPFRYAHDGEGSTSESEP